jgi:uncharacterized membrane protein YdfJ with MMPL/SSD domain
MTAGIVIDAFLVRSFLVPAAIVLLGRPGSDQIPPGRAGNSPGRRRDRVAANVAGAPDLPQP